MCITLTIFSIMGFILLHVVTRDFFILHHMLKYCENSTKIRPRNNTANIYLHILSMNHTDYKRNFRKKRTAARTSRPITGILVQFLKSISGYTK